MKYQGGVRAVVTEKVTCVKILSEQRFCILASDVKSLSIPFCQTPSGNNYQGWPLLKPKGWTKIAGMAAQLHQCALGLNPSQCASFIFFLYSNLDISTWHLFLHSLPHILSVLVTLVGLTCLSQIELLRIYSYSLWSQFVTCFTSSTCNSLASEILFNSGPSFPSEISTSK